MSKTKTAIPPEKLKLYDTLIESHPDAERKGKNNPYTSLNGHMFTFLSSDGIMGLRLSKEDREKFIKKFDSKLMEQHGRTMKEYVVIPDDLLTDTQKLLQYLEKSYNYILTLKPKPTKKSKKPRDMLQ